MLIRSMVIAVWFGLPTAAPDDSATAPSQSVPVEGVLVHGTANCNVCHTPESEDGVEAGPLWDDRPEAQKRFRLYDGRTGTPGTSSLLCLSCHDGSVAIDTFGAEPLRTEFVLGSRGRIGAHGDLGMDHPVGIRYPDHDRGYRPRAQVESDGAVRLPEGRVECVSCHDVHHPGVTDKLLVKPNDRSALCLTCHRK
ncbi:MAG: cytochrome c3 family protein [Phycisphaerales bacterium]|nr:cytochrome c3 family protein [Phycisphaerales bacterium]